MAIIDHEQDVVVLRLVYDGPPFSGKTTTLRTLASGLGVGFVTPEERGGRTMFFDWVDYVGGLFEGRRIRCQIVSVPGQPELAPRREALLETADAVVFVADSRAEAFDSALVMLRQTLERARSMDPPVGVVVQANKRDAESRLSIETVRRRLGAIAPVAVTETTATDGDGVREAFVFGVRLALDRVRALADEGQLITGALGDDGPARLLARLEALELDVNDRAEPRAVEPSASVAQDESRTTPEPASVVTVERSTPLPTDGEELQFSPDPSMPGGFIWPPVDGRTFLRQVAQFDLVPSRNAGGDWYASRGKWSCQSPAEAIYPDADEGRVALIQWARRHAVNRRQLSMARALILVDAGEGRYRMWQIVRGEPSLYDRLDLAVLTSPATELVSDIRAIAERLRGGREAAERAGLQEPCTMRTLATDSAGQVRYIGLMSLHGVEPGDDASTLREETLTLFERIQNQRDDYVEVMHELAGQLRAEASGAVRTMLAELVELATARSLGLGA